MSPASGRRRLDGLRPEEAERAIVQLPQERLYFFGADGRQVAIFDGSESYVFFRLDVRERARMRNGILVHNHPPRSHFLPTDPRYDADSFSPADWFVAADLDAARSIVVTPTWRFVLTRPDEGWFAFDESPEQIDFMVKSLYAQVAMEDAEAVRLGVATEELREATRSHRVNTRYAREIQAGYRRERR